MKKTSKTLQWVILYAMILWGFIAFMVLAGDDPENKLSLGKFLFIKFIAMLNFVGAAVTGYFAAEHGYLPDEKEFDRIFGED